MFQALSFIIIILGTYLLNSASFSPEFGCVWMSTVDNIPFFSKMLLTLVHVWVSAADVTANRHAPTSKHNIWVFILNPKIDFLLGDSLAQQHFFTAIFAATDWFK